MLQQFTGANALILGASRGIGLGFIQQLLLRPNIARIFAASRHPQDAPELMALVQQYPQRLSTVALDVTDEGQISQALAHIGIQVPELHLIINCVGLLHDGDLQPEKSLRHLKPETLLRYFRVNSMGPVLLAKHLLPLLRHGNHSLLATISARVGSIGDNYLGGWYGYRASKTALNMLMRNVAIEYRRTSPNTIVVLLHPGTTDTQLSKPFQRHVLPEKLFNVERTVTQLLRVLEQIQEGDSGEFFSWDGSRLPW